MSLLLHWLVSRYTSCCFMIFLLLLDRFLLTLSIFSYQNLIESSQPLDDDPMGLGQILM